MEFIRAIHMLDPSGGVMSFGIDTNGQIWLVLTNGKEVIYRGPFTNLTGFAAGLTQLTEMAVK